MTTFKEILDGITRHRANPIPSNQQFGPDVQRKIDEIEWALQALTERLLDSPFPDVSRLSLAPNDVLVIRLKDQVVSRELAHAIKKQIGEILPGVKTMIVDKLMDVSTIDGGKPS